MFTSIEEAQNSLGYIPTIGARSHPDKSPLAARTTPLETTQTKLSMELIRAVASLRLQQWNLAFTTVFTTLPLPLSISTQKSLLITQIHKLLIEASYRVDFWRAMTDETVWDVFSSEFTEIVRLAEEVVAAENGVEARFQLGTGIVFPLCFVAVKCRLYGLRRRAIRVLRMSERQEGVLE